MERRIKPPDQGFTLLELVIVVAVVALLSITTVFSVGRSSSSSGNDVLRFKTTYDQLRQAAILGREPKAMALRQKGFQALTYNNGHEPAGIDWLEASKAQLFSGEVRFQGLAAPLIPGFEEGELTPDLVFLSDGQVTSFAVSFISLDQVTRCTGSGWSGLNCEGF